MIDLSEISGLTATQVRTQIDEALISYDSPTQAEMDTAHNLLATLAAQKRIDEIVNDLHIEFSHMTAIFPENTDETVTFTAGNVNNTFGDWAEIVDNNAVTLSSKGVSKDLHISSVCVEDASARDKRYLLEIAYGDSKTVIARMRYIGGNLKIGTVGQTRSRPLALVAGETIYYRMKCEVADEILEVHIRYHLHQ